MKIENYAYILYVLCKSDGIPIDWLSYSVLVKMNENVRHVYIFIESPFMGKGTLRQLFICMRPKTLYFPPPPPWTRPSTSASARPAASSCQVGQPARPLCSQEVGVMKQSGFDLTDKTGSSQLHSCTRQSKRDISLYKSWNCNKSTDMTSG